MTDLRKAAELALKYFEDAYGLEDTEVAIREALRQALGTEQEGCAQCGKQASQGWALYCVECVGGKEWVGLTDEEKQGVLEDATGDGGHVYYDTLFQSYEAKLKEKNG